jgi:hypothetical protein
MDKFEKKLDEEQINKTYDDPHELACVIRQVDEWIPELNVQLCKLAGLSDEYAAADADTVESVLFKAADILSIKLV